MEKIYNPILLALPFALTSAIFVHADILKDFIVPPSLDPSTITRQFFTYTGFRNLKKANLTGQSIALISRATKKAFPALDGQGVSVAAVLYPPSGINPPHIHPRSSELVIVLEGILEVGFVDSTNKLFLQTLQASDMFIIPKGLVRFGVNTKSDCTAVALAIFGSSNSGTATIANNVFGSGISAEILAKAFKTDTETISKIIDANK